MILKKTILKILNLKKIELIFLFRCVIPEKNFKKDFINLKKSENISIQFKPELTKKDYLFKIKSKESYSERRYL